MESLNGRIAFCLLAFLFLGGCAEQESVKNEDPKPAAIATLSASQKQSRDLAVSAKDKLFQSLLTELASSIGENGVAQSIEVCKTAAPELAKTVGKEMGLKIGRTSFRLRNAENTPPEWAVPFVRQKTEKEVNVDLGDNGLGVLLPIRLKEACIKCHGNSDAIAGDVKDALANHYPNDNATGFAEGDLRGYFWMEVPVTRTQ